MMTTRPRTGYLGRSVVASVKVTPSESELMRKWYGTNASALRAAVNLLIEAANNHALPAGPQGSPKGPKRRRVLAPVQHDLLTADQTPVVPHDPDPYVPSKDYRVQVADHRHQRGERIGEVYVQGTEHRTYRCTEPGCTVTLTD